MKYVSYAVWVICSSLIVLTVLYFHWQSTNPESIDSLYSLATKYFFGSVAIGALSTFNLITSAVERNQHASMQNYNDQLSIASDRSFFAKVALKLFLLSITISAMLFTISYIPYF